MGDPEYRGGSSDHRTLRTTVPAYIWDSGPGRPDFFQRYSGEARQVLDAILDKYVEHGVSEFKMPEILQVPPISSHGNVREIAQFFGGPEQLRSAVSGLQSLLYTP